MKKAIILTILFISSIGFSQEKETTFEKEGDLVKATYYFDNGDVKVQATQLNNLPTTGAHTHTPISSGVRRNILEYHTRLHHPTLALHQDFKHSR